MITEAQESPSLGEPEEVLWWRIGEFDKSIEISPRAL